jgi:hypothetical protein
VKFSTPLNVLESWTKRKIFGLRKGEEAGEWKKLHEEFYNLCSY